MKTKLNILIALTVLILTSSKSKTYVDDYCSIYGVIYFEKNKYKADAMVYIEEEETLANLLVFEEDNRLFADEEGLWYITDNPALANYRLFKTSEKQFADFSVNFMEERAFVGCQ